jgi:heme exporter protein A
MTLAAERITLERNNQILLSQITFELNAGELLQIRGANGSGKSTLLRALAGLIEPEEGKVQWDNQSIFQYREIYQRCLHYVGHRNAVKPSLTVLENLKLHCALRAKKFDLLQNLAILQQVGLDELTSVFVTQLSAGQLRRLALARLLLHPAQLWILDEPMTALDSQGQTLLKNVLNQHVQQGGMAVIATHHDMLAAGNTKTITLGEQDV